MVCPRQLFVTVALAASAVLVPGAKPPIELSKPIVFRGACDASAAAALDDDRFVAVSDEENVLRVYARVKGGLPIQKIELSRFLELGYGKPETDLEGAARIQNRIFWISSHSRNKQGHDRPDRKRFFATDIVPGENPIVPAGRPYTRLLEDLTTAPQLAKYNLAKAARISPKEEGGLNIEALAATPEGHLLIGFRSPVPKGNALLVPLLNPNEMIQGARAKLGSPIELDLKGDGIRDMSLKGDKYVIIAGASTGGGADFLYQWKYGKPEAKSLRGGKLKGINAEAVAFFPGIEGFQIFCDSGQADGKIECKDLVQENARAFQSFVVED